jgi:tRNA(Arg) A34 adenosine deaminase TadA
MCTYALNLFGIKFVYFGQFNDKFGGCGSVMSRNNFKFRGGVKPDESIKLIK